MPDLEPITRDEMLWSGEDVEPITRREMYIRHLYDETQVIPDKPITREEMFILKAGEELHDVTIEQLNVSENGTYSESGKAYSPVIVDVPLPENAYLLKDFENVPSDIVTFNDGTALPMPSLKTTIVPIQDLHGYDSPWVGGAGKNKFNPNINDWVTSTYRYFKIPNFTDSIYVMSVVDNDTSVDVTDVNVGFMNNYPGDATEYRWVIVNGVVQSNMTNVSGRSQVNCNTIIIYPNSENAFNRLFQRYKIQVEKGTTATAYAPYENICPISGWTEAEVTVADDVDNPTVTHTTTIPFTDGDNPLTVYGGKVDLVSGVMTITHKILNLGDQTWGVADSSGGVNRFYVELNDMKSMTIRSMDVLCSCYKTNIGGGVFDDSTIYNTPSPTRIMINTSQYSDATALKNSLSGQTAVYELATPLTIQLTPTSIKSLEGVNNVWGDCGQILEGEYFSKEA